MKKKNVKIKWEGKVSAPLLRISAPAPYFHALFLTSKEDILLKKTLLQFLGFLLYPWKFEPKHGFTPRNSTKLLHPLEISRPKTKTP